jgi:tRNA modification GTPase
LIEGFRVAIVGKPNVGKSSLLNSLLNYDRAIISDIAGTTRDTIEEEIRIGTHLIKIVDTAGIREANDSIEQIGIERSKAAIENSEIVIAMFDNSREFDEEDNQILQMLKRYKDDKNILHVINKNDLEKKLDAEQLNEKITYLNCKNNADLIVSQIQEILDKSSLDETLLLTSKRQMEAVKNAYESIETSKDLLNEGELELFAFNLNEAIMYISSISRNFARTEILDKMFGSFCLGK